MAIFEIYCGNCHGLMAAKSPEIALRRLAVAKGKRAELGILMRWRRTCKKRGKIPIRDSTVPWFYQNTPRSIVQLVYR